VDGWHDAPPEDQLMIGMRKWIFWIGLINR